MAYVLTDGAMMRPWRGMGDASTAAQNVQVAGTVAAGTATAILGSLTSGGATAIFGITAAAVPVIGAALAGATMLVSALIKNSGCGVTCVQTSQWANQAGAALDKVIEAYFALPAPRTQAQQAVALANFDAIWAQLQQLCGQPGTGNAGVRCITDRQAGACHWKALPPKWPGEPATGECWNWFNAYRDPIAKDPVVPDPVPTSVSGALDSVLTSGTSSSALIPLLVIGGLIALGVSL